MAILVLTMPRPILPEDHEMLGTNSGETFPEVAELTPFIERLPLSEVFPHPEKSRIHTADASFLAFLPDTSDATLIANVRESTSAGGANNAKS